MDCQQFWGFDISIREYFHESKRVESIGRSGVPCIAKWSVVWRRLPSLPYRGRPVGPAGEERGPSMFSTRLVSFVAPQAGQPAIQQTGLSRCILFSDAVRQGEWVTEWEMRSATESRLQSQRDCVLQPKVARHELPWVVVWKWIQPQRGCGLTPPNGNRIWSQPRWGWFPLTKRDPR